MLENAPGPAVVAETNLPAPDSGDGGTGACSELRIREHQKRIDETRGEREKVRWGYRYLAHAAYADWKRLSGYDHATGELRTVQAADRKVSETIDRYWKDWQESELERAGAVVGAENELARLHKALELALENRDRYAKAADMVAGCSAGLMKGVATGCEKLCATHGVAGCNRILCPLCAPGRASEEVATYAPAIAELLDVECWVLTIRNVGRGKLDAGQRQLLPASRKLRRTRWFLDRFDSGIQSLEVTANVRRKEWHPHLNLIVGNMNEIVGNMNERETDARDPRTIGRRKTELETEWGRSLGVLHHRRGCPKRLHESTCPDTGDVCDRWGRKGIRRVKRLACGVCRARHELPETERECSCGAYRPIVWIDRPYFLERHLGKERRVYADDLTDEDERAKVYEHATREALKYITKGVSGIPRSWLPELIAAKEKRRWMQSFGALNAQGILACPTCRRRWKKAEQGEKCPHCPEPRPVGVPPRELEDRKPWQCEHGHDFTPEGYVSVPFEEWAALNPIGLLTRRKSRQPTGPPSAQRRLGETR